MIGSLSIDDSNVYIDYLSEHIEFSSEISGWLFKEWTKWYNDWGIDNEGAAFKDLINDLGRSKSGNLPIIIVAYVNNKPVGCIGLDNEDMPNPPEQIEGIGPWIVNVYVVDEFRGKGLGSILVKIMMDRARKEKINKLYLLTDTKKKFYERLGWIEKSVVNYLDRPYHFMEFTIQEII